MKAYADGATIQLKGHFELSWFTHDSPNFDSDYNYRIKPEPKLRPWKPDEVPVGALIRIKNSNWLTIISGRNKHEISTPTLSGPNECHSLDYALRHLEHSTDGGKTWLPCGVEEEL